jgi:hypothetical protein
MEERLDETTTINPFQAYLDRYHLSVLEVSLVSRVRYSTVWNILHDKPVRPDHAALVRRGLKLLTGVAYTAPIAQLTDYPSKETHHAR